MKIALIGGTGFVGSHLLHEALTRGHQVTAIVRDPAKLTEKNDHLTVVTGDVNNPEQLAQQLAGHDVVLNAFNAGWGNPNLYNDSLAGSRAIEQATEQSGVPRLFVIGGAGSLYIDGHQLVDGPQFPAEYKAGATAARDYLNELKQNTKLDWTFLSPAIEMHQGIDTGRTGHYRLGTENPVFNAEGRSILSGEDLAVAALDELEKHQFSRQRFTAAY
ncbi:NAD(P)-dependent oxidoreductase [Hymenobacter ginsengisoli]|uniref:NAD(P)-dependent oxidoreductase n=1 Tax=Hymenobacter ginsengisoli TaxID=1051626 RepID=A0ABP8Q6R7_9BACT|nr:MULTISPECIES: NAD(P)-dependent oxidoreductase [unclassified Hymenobacter]MBO2031830.1 NAD(P)-dependent oxidoreductase [Hymenobacter sp. BT559]